MSLRESNSKKVIIIRFNDFDKRKLLISILVIIKLEPRAKEINKVIISMDAYGTTY